MSRSPALSLTASPGRTPGRSLPRPAPAPAAGIDPGGLAAACAPQRRRAARRGARLGLPQPPALARRGDGQVVTLTPLLHAVLAAIDGRRTVAEVAEAVSAASGRLVRPDDVRQLVGRHAAPARAARLADGSEPEVRRANPLLALRLRRVVTDPAVTRRITAPFAVLFHPARRRPVVLALRRRLGWVLFREGLAAATAQAFPVPAVPARRRRHRAVGRLPRVRPRRGRRYGGATPGAMGVGLYLVLAGVLHRRHRQLPARPRPAGCAPTSAASTSTRSWRGDRSASGG